MVLLKRRQRCLTKAFDKGFDLLAFDRALPFEWQSLLCFTKGFLKRNISARLTLTFPAGLLVLWTAEVNN